MGDTPVDPGVLRTQVSEKYRGVATEPAGDYHLLTGREPAARLGYPADVVGALPDVAVESFAGVCTAAACAEDRRVLRPGGWLQFADIADGRPVPVEAMRDIDLWTG